VVEFNEISALSLGQRRSLNIYEESVINMLTPSPTRDNNDIYVPNNMKCSQMIQVPYPIQYMHPYHVIIVEENN